MTARYSFGRNYQLQEERRLGTTDSAAVVIKRLLEITHPMRVNNTVLLHKKNPNLLFSPTPAEEIGRMLSRTKNREEGTTPQITSAAPRLPAPGAPSSPPLPSHQEAPKSRFLPSRRVTGRARSGCAPSRLRPGTRPRRWAAREGRETGRTTT